MPDYITYLFIYLFIYLLICVLFKDTVSPSDHLFPANAQIANNWSITSATRYGFMPGAVKQPQLSLL